MPLLKELQKISASGIYKHLAPNGANPGTRSVAPWVMSDPHSLPTSYSIHQSSFDQPLHQ